MGQLNNPFMSAWLVSVVKVIQLKGLVATAAEESLQS